MTDDFPADDCQATKRANKAASAEPIDQLSQTAEPINVIGQALDAVQQHRGNPDSATEEGSQEDSSTQQAVLEEAPEPAAAKRPIQGISLCACKPVIIHLTHSSILIRLFTTKWSYHTSINVAALSKARGKKSRLGPQNRGKKPEVCYFGEIPRCAWQHDCECCFKRFLGHPHPELVIGSYQHI